MSSEVRAALKQETRPRAYSLTFIISKEQSLPVVTVPSYSYNVSVLWLPTPNATLVRYRCSWSSLIPKAFFNIAP